MDTTAPEQPPHDDNSPVTIHVVIPPRTENEHAHIEVDDPAPEGNDTTTPPINYFDFNEANVEMARYHDRRHRLPAALQTHLDERALQLELLDQGQMYICPNACPIVPSAQYAPMSLTGMLAQGHASGFASHTGAAMAHDGGAANDASTAVANDMATKQILKLQRVAELFAQKQGHFMGWRRVTVLLPAGASPRLSTK